MDRVSDPPVEQQALPFERPRPRYCRRHRHRAAIAWATVTFLGYSVTYGFCGFCLAGARKREGLEGAVWER